MDLISLPFAGFFLITLLVYHALPGDKRKLWLLVTSVVFYGMMDIRYLLVLALLTVFNYWFVKKFNEIKKDYGAYFVPALLLNLSVFICLKVLTSRYAGLVYPAANDITNKWLLPVGFSFYILQLISLHLNIRNRQLTKVPGFIDFALYLAYFPKITSGPIEKPRLFLDKLSKLPSLENFDFSRGLGLILIGLIRKMLIVKILYFYIPNWLADADKAGWVQIITFTMLVYNDFAGYTSIVRGLSCLFGLELSENFQQPFFARNFSEFWSKWHITLSTWLRETIYFPLSRKLGKNSHLPALAVVLPPLATMLASGFWHGVSLALVVWGTIHGLYLVIERLIYEKFPRMRPQNLSKFWQVGSMVVVFILFTYTMVPFAVTTFKQTLMVWKNMLIHPVIGTQSATPLLFAAVVFSFVLDYMAQRKKTELWWLDLPLIPRSAMVAFGIILLAFAIGLNIQTAGSVFIYQGF
jgi:D-alanyl-lipoteichoic acid acyltransferase DltB (MBOAT superfamily)